MIPTKETIRIYLEILKTNEQKLTKLRYFRYQVENNTNALSPTLSTSDQTLLDIIDNEIEFYKKKLKKDRITNKNTITKGERVLNFSFEFITNLRSSTFETQKEILYALKRIEPKYSCTTNLLKADGSPIEKRICIALSEIFSIKFPNEKVDWTTIRDHLKSKGLNIPTS